MFVKKIPKWKIKRLFKRVLKAFILFGILLSLTCTCFAKSNTAYQFVDFETFVGNDGFVSYLLRNSSSSIVRSGELYPDSHNLNDMTFAYNYSSSFTSARLTIEDSKNVNINFNAGDTFVLRHNITVHLSGAQVADTYADLFTITLNYVDKTTNVLGSVELRGNQVLKAHSFTNYSWGSSVFYEVDLNTTLPMVDGSVTSLSYHFYNITPDSYSFRIYPVSTGNVSIPLTYFIGDSTKAPIYPQYDTSTPDLDNAIDDYNRVDADADAIFNDASSSFFTFMEAALGGIGTFLYPIISAVSTIVSAVLGSLPQPVQYAFSFALIIGMVAFVMGLISTVISRWRST